MSTWRIDPIFQLPGTSKCYRRNARRSEHHNQLETCLLRLGQVLQDMADIVATTGEPIERRDHGVITEYSERPDHLRAVRIGFPRCLKNSANVPARLRISERRRYIERAIRIIHPAESAADTAQDQHNLMVGHFFSSKRQLRAKFSSRLPSPLHPTPIQHANHA